MYVKMWSDCYNEQDDSTRYNKKKANRTQSIYWPGENYSRLNRVCWQAYDYL